MICKLCNKNIGNKGFNSHLKFHNISDKDYYDTYEKSMEDGKCKTCGKHTKFLGATRGYIEFCCPHCAQIHQDTRNKYKNTCIEKYGAENVFASEYGKDKIKRTNLIKYDAEYYLTTSEFRRKAEKTCRKKYGCKNPQQNGNIKNKTNQTNINRYGSICPLNNINVWNKAIRTMRDGGKLSSLERYFENKLNEIGYIFNVDYYYQHKDLRYPYFCDFYLIKSDTFIEINGFWTHGGHFFDENNPADVEKLETWKSKNSKFYNLAIDVWSISDKQKLKTATDNNLNYIVLWNKLDIDGFISLLSPQ